MAACEISPTDRARYVEEVLQQTAYRNSELVDAVVDLLIDLQHLCDMKALNFQSCLAQSREHYASEVREFGQAGAMAVAA